jgi:hypothetical protein
LILPVIVAGATTDVTTVTLPASVSVPVPVATAAPPSRIRPPMISFLSLRSSLPSERIVTGAASGISVT